MLYTGFTLSPFVANKNKLRFVEYENTSLSQHRFSLISSVREGMPHPRRNRDFCDDWSSFSFLRLFLTAFFHLHPSEGLCPPAGFFLSISGGTACFASRCAMFERHSVSKWWEKFTRFCLDLSLGPFCMLPHFSTDWALGTRPRGGCNSLEELVVKTFGYWLTEAR